MVWVSVQWPSLVVRAIFTEVVVELTKTGAFQFPLSLEA